MTNSMPTNEEIMAQDGVALTSAAHPEDPKMIERLCRAVCKTQGIDPDKESEGLGVVMPRGLRYRLWEAQRAVVQAVLAELAVIDSEMQLNPESLVTVTTSEIGMVTEIEVLPGETILDALQRQGRRLKP